MQPEGENKIVSAEQEIEILRKRIAELESGAGDKEKKEAIKEAIKKHAEQPGENVFSDAYHLAEKEKEAHAKRISIIPPEPEYQRQTQELLQLAQDKGVLNAVSIAKKIDDPHLEDSFHDALVIFLTNIKMK